MKELNYEQDLQINEHALEREFITQSSKYMEYAEAAADADYDRKKAKENLEVVRAEVANGIREDAADAGEKITEKAIETTIPMKTEYKEAHEEFLKADHDYLIMGAAVRAFEMKKGSLENLVKLLLGGYFSAPREEPVETAAGKPRTISDSSSDKQKAALKKKRKKKTGTKKVD